MHKLKYVRVYSTYTAMHTICTGAHMPRAHAHEHWCAHVWVCEVRRVGARATAVLVEARASMGGRQRERKSENESARAQRESDSQGWRDSTV